MPRIIALGEIMVELAPAPNGLLRLGYAGDTFNTAWYARRLLPDDWTVAYGTVLGCDKVSDDIAAFMQGQGIDTTPVRRHPDRTAGLYMITLDQGERSFSYWRSQSAARTLADDAIWLARMLHGADFAYISGITLAILAPDRRRALCDALAAARGAGTQVVFDTNLRLRLWDSPDAARAGLTQGAQVADIVLPSFDEETALFGDATPEDII
ncbi:MAG: sugar kinase, partial [Primorskyibacter sp.]